MDNINEDSPSLSENHEYSNIEVSDKLVYAVLRMNIIRSRKKEYEIKVISIHLDKSHAMQFMIKSAQHHYSGIGYEKKLIGSYRIEIRSIPRRNSYEKKLIKSIFLVDSFRATNKSDFDSL